MAKRSRNVFEMGFKKKTLITFQVHDLIFPLRPEDFHGYFIGKCFYCVHEDEKNLDISPDITKNVVTIHGKILSPRPYFLYTGYVKTANVENNETNFFIDQIIAIRRSPLNEFLLKTMIENESNLSSSQCATIFESAESNGGINITNPVLVPWINSTDYVKLESKFYLVRVFPEHPGRIRKLTPTELIMLSTRISEDPFEIIISGETILGLGTAILENYFKLYAAETHQYVKEIRFLYAMRLVQQRNLNTLQSPSDVVSKYMDCFNEELTEEEFISIINVLREKGKIVLDDKHEGMIEFSKDFEAENTIIKLLSEMNSRFRAGDYKDRGAELFKTLPRETMTDEQWRSIEHALTHSITVVRGIAGSGKTQTPQYFCKHVPGGFAVTFVGLQSVNLKSRLGTGQTLHALIFRHHKMMRTSKKKKRMIYDRLSRELCSCETIIFDEISNISLHDFADVLSVICSKDIANSHARKNIIRMVLCGDIEQIGPIGVGQPGVDLATHLGPHIISYIQNLRVEQNARMLVDIDHLLIDGNPTWIDKCDIGLEGNSPVKLLPTTDLPNTLAAIIEHEKSAYNNSSIETVNHTAFLALEKVDVQHLAKSLQNALKMKDASTNTLLEVGRRFMVVDRLFRRKFVCKYGSRTVYSDEARNGQIYEVSRLYSLNMTNRFTHSVRSVGRMEIINMPKNECLFVTTVCGKTFCVKKGFLDPECITCGDVATVNKMQGSEADLVVAYLRPGISKNKGWIRNFLHVVMSRPRRKLFIIANKEDLVTISERTAVPRLTRLPELLTGLVDEISA
jgi:hypothetical protein